MRSVANDSAATVAVAGELHEEIIDLLLGDVGPSQAGSFLRCIGDRQGINCALQRIFCNAADEDPLGPPELPPHAIALSVTRPLSKGKPGHIFPAGASFTVTASAKTFLTQVPTAVPLARKLLVTSF